MKTSHIGFRARDVTDLWTEIPINDVYKIQNYPEGMIVTDIHNIPRLTKEIFFLDLSQRVARPNPPTPPTKNANSQSR